MLDSFIIVGLTMVLVTIVKSFKPFDSDIGKKCVPLLVFGIAGTLNVLNAVVFSGSLLEALNQGLVLGAVSGGIYSMGKAALDGK